MTTFNCVYTFNNHSLCQHSKPHTKKKINARGSALRILRERSNTKKKKRHHIPPNIFWRFSTFSFVSLCKSMPFTADSFFFLCSFLDFPVEFFFFFFFLDFGFLPNLLFFFFFPFSSFLLCFFFSLFFFLFFFFRGVGEEMWRGTKSDTDG